MQRTAHMGSLSTPVISHVNFSKDSPTTHNITNLPRGKYVVCGEAYSEGIIYQAGCTEIIVEKLETKSKIMKIILALLIHAQTCGQGSFRCSVYVWIF